MPEGASHGQGLRAGTPVRVGTVTLLPVERVVLRSDQGPGRQWVLADKRPHALIVRDESRTWAVGIEGAAVRLETLIEQVQGLDEALASM